MNLTKLIHRSLLACAAAVLTSVGVYAAPNLSETVESSAEIIDVPSVKASLESASSIKDGFLDLPETVREIIDEVLAKASLSSADDAELFATAFSGGSGTETDPYLLSSAKDLRNLSVYVNAGVAKYVSAHYLLTADVDMQGLEWISIGHYTDDEGYSVAFCGTFDGGGHTVSNMTINMPDNRYTGFFGLVYNGSVNRLTIKNITVDYDYSGYVYTGALIGRLVATDGREHSVTDCHVYTGSGSGVHIYNEDRPLYGGGLIGYVTAENATVNIENCTSDVSADYTISGINSTSNGRMTIRSGGFIGYLASTGGSVTVRRCASSGSSFADIANLSGSVSDSVHNGGFIGYVGANDVGKILIEQCENVSAVLSSAYGETYTGGFMGYAISDAIADVTIQDCFTSSSVYYESTDSPSYAAGFSTIAATQRNGKLTFANNYADCDLYEIHSKESMSGRFIAYRMGTITFTNCFSFSSAAMNVSGTAARAVEKVLNDAARIKLASYAFDNTVWTISTTGYPYPTLIGLTMPENRGVWYFKGNDLYNAASYAFGTVVEPKEKDAPYSDRYLFDCFTLLDGNMNLKVETLTLTKDIFLFANFSEEYKSFTVSFFMSDGAAVGTDSVRYGEYVDFPAVTPPEGNEFYRFEFDHWSLDQEDTKPVDTEGTAVFGDTSYYAQFRKVDIGVWDGESFADFTRGSGTETDPYVISSGAQLANIATILDTLSADSYFKLDADIDLGANEWTPLGSEDTPFMGHFDGNGYGVSSFTITKVQPQLGLFGYALNAVFTDLEVSDFTIAVTDEEGTVTAGGLVGTLFADHGTSRIERCFTNGDMALTAHIICAGGLCGVAEEAEAKMQALDIIDSYSYTAIVGDGTGGATASVVLGGISGRLRSHSEGARGIDRCYYRGSITAYGGTTNVAGIVGVPRDNAPFISGDLSEAAVSGTIRNCFAECEINVISSSYSCYAGSIYGAIASDVTFENCYKVEGSEIGGKEYTDNVTVVAADVLLDEEYLHDNLGFDFDTVWTMPDGYPVLRSLNAPRELYKVDEASFDAENGTLNVELRICRRNGVPYTVIAAAYDERSKMIHFETVQIDTPEELHTLHLGFKQLQGAKSAVVTVVDPSLTLIEKPLMFE